MKLRANRSRTVLLFCLVVSLLLFVNLLHAQNTTQLDDKVLKNLKWRNIGPAIMGGRLDDVAVVEKNPSTFYIGAAASGVWKTTNNGTTWEPVFDSANSGMTSVGAVAVSQADPNVVWVGTGEPNNRQSSSWGDGMYKSTDGGKTWQNVGLRDTHHIGRIVADPKDANIAYVAAIGHLWGPNQERGLFKTTDGGKTWTNTKFIDENTGFTDVVMDPKDNNTLYAASYQRQRKVYNFVGGGPGSALWKTTDGGKTWTKLTNGLPTTDLGRMGLDICRAKPNVVYAIVEAQSTDGGVFRSEDSGQTWTKMSSYNPRPMYFSLIRVNPQNDQHIYLGGVNMSVSTNGGKTFQTIASQVHSDHHAMWINPNNPDHIISGNDGGIVMSYDAGKNWTHINNIPLAQMYTVGYDMREPYNVYIGLQDNYTWTGPSATRRRVGILNDDWFQILGGDGMSAVVDPSDASTVYANSQDGRTVRYDVATGERKSVRPPTPKQGEPALRWNWTTPIVISPHDSKTVYLIGNIVWKSKDRGENWEAISPDLTKKWDRDKVAPIMGMTPERGKTLSYTDGIAHVSAGVAFAESPAKAGLLIFGSDDGNVQISNNGGKNWEEISGRFAGLGKNAYVGSVEFSAHDANTIYITFDNHRDNDFKSYVYTTTDAGKTWRSLSQGLPDTSAHVIKEDPRNRNLLFLGTENGIWVSNTRGDGWVRLKNGLPNVPVFDIQIHPRDRELILGTHARGVYIMDIAPLQDLSPEAMAKDVTLLTPAPATMYIPDDHKGFLANNTYVGANRPFGMSIDYYLKGEAKEVKLGIYDKKGQLVRDLPATKEVGLNRVTWNYQMNPPPRPQFGPGGGGPGGGGPGGGNRGGGPGGGGPGGGANPQPPAPDPIPAIAGDVGGGGEIRAGGGPGGGGQNFGFGGPNVMPGEYVAKLTVDGKEVGSVPVVVKLDPRVRATEAERKVLYDLVNESYRLQAVSTPVMTNITQLNNQLSATTKALGEMKDAPASAKTAADDAQKKLSAVQTKLSQNIQQFAASMREAGATNQAPTGTNQQAFKAAVADFQKNIATLNELIQKTLPALNEQFEKDKLPESIPRLKPGNPVSVEIKK